MATNWVVVLALAFMVGNFVKGKNVTKILMVTILLTFLIKKGVVLEKFCMCSKLFLAMTFVSPCMQILKLSLKFASVSSV